MSRTAKITQPLKWHGGKHYLADWIIGLMPPHVHYVEPYAGGLAVLLAKDPNDVSEVVNDVHHELTNFWRVLQRPATFKRLQQLVEALPFSEYEWESADVLLQTSSDAVRLAAAFFVRCRQSRAGKFDCFATLSRNRTRRRMNEQASAWMTAVEGLPEVAARLKRVAILCGDALDVIRQQDGPNTLFYLDPPYLPETRAGTGDYAHEMSRDDHMALLRVIKNCEGKVMLSGYPNDLYGQLLPDWRTADKQIDNKAAGGAKKRKMTERLWMNFPPAG